MSGQGDEFERYAKAERQLCEEAAPLLASIVHDVEHRAGLRITEVRVTIDWSASSKGSIAANCTIVGAHDPMNAYSPPSADANAAMKRD